jgi:hypothetical protein
VRDRQITGRHRDQTDLYQALLSYTQSYFLLREAKGYNDVMYTQKFVDLA